MVSHNRLNVLALHIEAKPVNKGELILVVVGILLALSIFTAILIDSALKKLSSCFFRAS